MTWLDRAALCLEMRNALLVVLLLATAGCGGYRFPVPVGGSGTVSGQVVAYPCGPIEPANQKCLPVPAADCAPNPPNAASCVGWPMPDMVLVFIKGDTTLKSKTDSRGYYSIELPIGTWSVGTVDYARIIKGPQTLVVSSGDNIVANYVIDTGIRAAA